MRVRKHGRTMLAEWQAEEKTWLANVVDIKQHGELRNPYEPREEKGALRSPWMNQQLIDRNRIDPTTTTPRAPGRKHGLWITSTRSHWRAERGCRGVRREVCRMCDAVRCSLTVGDT